MLSESLLIKKILFLHFKICFIILTHFNDSIFIKQNYFILFLDRQTDR